MRNMVMAKNQIMEQQKKNINDWLKEQNDMTQKINAQKLVDKEKIQD